MLNELKKEANLTTTDNGAVTYVSTESFCLDLFSSIGASRDLEREEVEAMFQRAYAEDKKLALKILFFARDLRGGLGEREVFRIIIRWLAHNDKDAVIRNIKYITEFGRFDDLLCLLSTPVESEVIAIISAQLKDDLDNMNKGNPVSLLAKWLPSINASSYQSLHDALIIAKALGLSNAEYRKYLSALRKHIGIIENNLREKDYTFDYSKLPSGALFKYREAFMREDYERYAKFLNSVESGEAKLNASTLMPYQVVNPIINLYKDFDSTERQALDATWNSLPNYTNGQNALVVMDGSGSMYTSYASVYPINVAISLAIYFAERNEGHYKNNFITFSKTPRLVEIKGEDIYEKVKYCMTFFEIANTNLEKVFNLILRTAIKYNLPQSELPEMIYIISDMEFDSCVDTDGMTNFQSAKQKFESHGYKLPTVVFWNVYASTKNQPVTKNEQGVILVSGCNPTLFSMVTSGDIDPYKFMLQTLSVERYSGIE